MDKIDKICMKDVSVVFKGKVKAVDHVNLQIETGIFGLLGENGAGKTTLMRVLTTLLKPSEGEVFLGDMKYSEKNYERVQKRIGYLPQELSLYPNLTLWESLMYMGEMAGIPGKKCRTTLEYYLEKTSLMEHCRKKNRQLSGGMRRRAGLVQALLHDPEVLIVDEPTTGLDPEERIRIRNLLVEFGQNRIVLFSTHVIEDLSATCRELAVMKGGRIIYTGSIRALMKQAEGHVWSANITNERILDKLPKHCHIASKQLTETGIKVRLISRDAPAFSCMAEEVTLEDAYIYVSNGN